MSLSFYYLAIASVFLCPVEKQETKNTPGSDGLPGNTNSIKMLTVKQATELAKFEGYLRLNGLTTISVEVASELAKYKGDLLILDGLTTISVEVATELAKYKDKGFLSLNGLTTISVEVAKELAKFKGYLILDGLTTISVEVAKELAKHKGDLALRGLTTISVEVASELVKYKSDLGLVGLKTVSPKTLAILKANPKIALSKKVEVSAQKNTPRGKDSEQETDEDYPLRKLGWSTKKCMLCNALRNPRASVLYSDKKGYGFCLDCGKNADTVVLSNEAFKKGIPLNAETAALVKAHVESIQRLFPPNWRDNEIERTKGLMILTGFMKWRDWENAWENAVILGLKKSDINR